MLRKILAIAIAVLCISIATLNTEIRMPLATEPSPSNPGPGGLTKFVSMLEERGYIVVEPQSLEDAVRYLSATSPKISVLLVLGIAKNDVKAIDQVKDWVAWGGELVVMDELNDVDPLVESFGIVKTQPIIATTNATCVNGTTVLFDVFALVSGGAPLCSSAGMVLAVEKRFGEGSVIVVGDSSLVINYIHNFPFYRNNSAFLLTIFGKRRVIVVYYPPSKAFAHLRLLKIVEGIVDGIEWLLGYVVQSPVALPLLAVFSVVIAALMIGERGEEASGVAPVDRVIIEVRAELARVVNRLREVVNRGRSVA